MTCPRSPSLLMAGPEIENRSPAPGLRALSTCGFHLVGVCLSGPEGGAGGWLSYGGQGALAQAQGGNPSSKGTL